MLFILADDLGNILIEKLQMQLDKLQEELSDESEEDSDIDEKYM